MMRRRACAASRPSSIAPSSESRSNGARRADQRFDDRRSLCGQAPQPRARHRAPRRRLPAYLRVQRRAVVGADRGRDSALRPSLAVPLPSVPTSRTITGRGASESAVINPAIPAPTMTASPDQNRLIVMPRSCARPRCRAPGGGSTRIECDLRGVMVCSEREDLRQRDALHVRAEIARAHELDVGEFDARRCRSSSTR